MKIESLKNTLVQSIGIAEKIAGKNLTLPVLSCVLLTAKNKTLRVRSTNLDLGIEIEIPAKIFEEGEVAVPGGVLYSVLSTMIGDDGIVLETINGNLSIINKHSETVIKAQQHEDFPTLPIINSEHSVEIKASDFVKGIRSVWYSASTSTIKPELSSVYVYYEDGKMVFVATDSFRLSEKTVPLKGAAEFTPILVPFRNIPEIIRVLENIEGTIEIHITSNQLSFIFDKTYLTSRLIDGVFPDYKQIVPKKSTSEAVVLKQDLLQTLKKINIFSDKFNQVNFSISPTEKVFSLRSKNMDVGETTETVDAALSGEALEINFNHKYITDCFQSINSDSVTLSFNGLSKPVVLTGVSDPSFLYLVMPMNR